ncbi:MAG TPA: TetR/AcrR family transcriptional regulator [Burkholderiales bacterium]|nr:TetR/AcrR family transcriptional regulator [Burkholderiales bacterium]
MSATPANRERVLRAATAAFTLDGYRASIDRIALRAGVAKQTVYAHFHSKDDLFKEVVREMASRVLVQLDAESDLRAGLLGFALAYRSRVLRPEGVAMFRTLTAEIPRFPSIARAIYDAGSGETARGLARYVERAMQEGRLRRDDPRFAAEMLLGMLVGHDRIKRLFGVARFYAAGEARRAARVVDSFLRMYSNESPPR